VFLPRRWRMVCFFIVTPWQIGVILTANYTFLNYLVLVLGLLLLDDCFLVHFAPRRWGARLLEQVNMTAGGNAGPGAFDSQSILRTTPSTDALAAGEAREPSWTEQLRYYAMPLKLVLMGVMLGWMFYASMALLIWMILPGVPLPSTPVAALEPFRIADRYGLFAMMTRGRYEIEFQGSMDGQDWVTYPFRYKPQDLNKAPRIYAPYQPRFDWNLWFASLGAWRANPIVPRTEERLLAGDADVLALFAANPFPQEPPRQVRAVCWQYWFTTAEEKRTQGLWWRRQFLGLYAPTLAREQNGRISVVEWPLALAPRE
jgi:hypothetical protein